MPVGIITLLTQGYKALATLEWLALRQNLSLKNAYAWARHSRELTPDLRQLFGCGWWHMVNSRCSEWYKTAEYLCVDFKDNENKKWPTYFVPRSIFIYDIYLGI